MGLFNSLQKKQAPVQQVAQNATATAQGPVKAPPKFGLSASAPVQKKDVLGPRQLESAKAFYNTNSADFTSKVIKQIQNKLGVTPSGAIDDATLQAVAKFQKDNGLDVDGKLGPQSLPKLFTHGLATESAEKTYIKAYLGIDWSTLKTAEERGSKMVGLANKRLKAAGVPECAVRVEDLGEDSGQFDFTDWSILVGNDFLGQEELTQTQLDDFANTVLHEARHAEQWFNIAQLLAGRGKTAREIADELGIPNKIAKAAKDKPLKLNEVKSLVAKNWYESIYGSGSDHRDHVLGDEGTYEDYRALPEESDAWRVGDEFDAKLKSERKRLAQEKDAKKKLEDEKKAKKAKPKETKKEPKKETKGKKSK